MWQEESDANDLRGHRLQPTDPMHGLTTAINERIYPEMLPKRIRPTQASWTTALLLPQRCKQGSRRSQLELC